MRYVKCDWRPTRLAFLDFETESQAELRDMTAHKYAVDPSTRVLTCVVKADGVVHRFGPYLDDDARQKLQSIASTHTLVAHNAAFDATVWEHTAKLGPAKWFDTLPCARAAGFPGKLDDLGRIITGQGKDANGKRLVEMLCVIKGRKPPAIGPAHGLLMEYCVRDVELLEQIYERVAPFGEPDVMTADRAINDRGVPIDRKLLRRLIDLYKVNTERMGDEFDRIAGVNPRSVKQVKEWMREKGFTVPMVESRDKGLHESLNKTAFKKFMDNPDQYFIGDGDEDAAISMMVEALDTRREVVRVGKGKADACMLALDDDDRIRDQFVYYGAQKTGRWAGRAFQMQNMPTTMAVKDIDIMALQEEGADWDRLDQVARQFTAVNAEKDLPKIGVTDILNAMLRHLVKADNFLVADYNGVEARCVAYVSGCGRMLDMYSRNESVYLDMARTVFNRPITKNDSQEYSVGKNLVLGCIYGMSGTKFAAIATSRNIQTAALASMGITIADTVKIFRKTYPELPAVWKAYHEALHDAVKGVSTEAGRCFFGMVGSDLHIVLPSGRPLVYRNSRIEMRVPGYCALYGMPETPVPTVVHDSARMNSNDYMYGSKACENICQAICRDFLAQKLVDLEQAGFPVVLHVHDEIGAEAPHSRFKEYVEIMSCPPSWAADFPLMVEGYSGPLWTKQTKVPGHRKCDCKNCYPTLDALSGRIMP
jgi:DNA polymerase bacteriophage-type